MWWVLLGGWVEEWRGGISDRYLGSSGLISSEPSFTQLTSKLLARLGSHWAWQVNWTTDPRTTCWSWGRSTIRVGSDHNNDNSSSEVEDA